MAKKEKSVAERFKEMHARAEKRDSYHVEAAKFELSEQIFVAMEENGISEAELSRRLGVSRAYVNKILQGSANLTIESIVKIARALNCELIFEFKKGSQKSRKVQGVELNGNGSARKKKIPARN